jgi:lipopolysaccharide export system permease protein
MSIIHKYIKKMLVKSVLIVSFMFLVISVFFKILSQIKFLGKGGYDIYQMLAYVLLLQPRVMYSFFPLISLISLCFVMLRLIVRKELVAFAAMGAGIFDIIIITATTMIQVILLSVFIGEGLSPYATSFANESRMSVLYNGKFVSVKGQVWLKEGDWFTNIGSMTQGNILHNITRYHLDENNSIDLVEYVKKAEKKSGTWHAKGVDWTKIENDKTITGHKKSTIWNTEIDTRLLDTYDSSASKLPLWVLVNRVFYGFKLGLVNDYYTLVFWQRIFQPIVCLLMLFIAIVVFFDLECSNYTSKTMAKALSLGFIYYLLKDIIGTSLLMLGVYPWFAAFFPIILGIAAFVILLQQYLGGNIITRYINKDRYK